MFSFHIYTIVKCHGKRQCPPLPLGLSSPCWYYGLCPLFPPCIKSSAQKGKRIYLRGTSETHQGAAGECHSMCPIPTAKPGKRAATDHWTDKVLCWDTRRGGGRSEETELLDGITEGKHSGLIHMFLGNP